MRKQVFLLCAIVIVAVAAFCVFVDAIEAKNFKIESTEYCRVSLDDPKSNLNVRTFDGEVIGKLRHGTRVWVNEYSGEWARVSVKKGKRWTVVGWVDSNYLACG